MGLIPSSREHESKNLAFRSRDTVMRLKRLGSFHQSRLSFMRVLLRRLKGEKWQFDRPVFDLNEAGVGVATYRAVGPKRVYTLVAFAHDLPDEKRSDRVIADAWDATFALVDGEPTPDDLARLSKNVPLQEAGRVSGKEFVLSRANKSVRLFNHVLEALASGNQPSLEEIQKVGYLMRTTAVYGSGKFGAADRSFWAKRSEFEGSFQPELLAVWLIRCFAIDWVEHLAKMKGGSQAVTLDHSLRRSLGIGNSTGLGMAPFLINHPTLIHAWIQARETALARVCALPEAKPVEQQRFLELVDRARFNAENWYTDHPHQKGKVECLLKDFEKIDDFLKAGILAEPFPWQKLVNWSEEILGFEGREQLASLVLEPYGHLVDDLAAQMHADEAVDFRIDGAMTIGQFKAIFERDYRWIKEFDFSDQSANARIWYTSEEKLEPRLGERYEEDLEAYEQPLSPGRDATRLSKALEDQDEQDTIASLLMRYPEHRHMVRRVQRLRDRPFGEIRDNTIDAKMMPIDLLRCKLSFFGATKFDPRSDRWVRITMYQGAPFPDELSHMDPDDCAYPVQYGR